MKNLVQCAIEVRRHSPRHLVRCHGCWFTHSQFHSRRYSLRITLKSTTLVRMRSGSAWTSIHDTAAEVTNSLDSALIQAKNKTSFLHFQVSFRHAESCASRPETGANHWWSSSALLGPRPWTARCSPPRPMWAECASTMVNKTTVQV